MRAFRENRLEHIHAVPACLLLAWRGMARYDAMAFDFAFSLHLLLQAYSLLEANEVVKPDPPNILPSSFFLGRLRCIGRQWPKHVAFM